MALTVGARVAHYDVTALIGQGGIRRLSDDRISSGDDFNGLILVQNFFEELKARIPVP